MTGRNKTKKLPGRGNDAEAPGAVLAQRYELVELLGKGGTSDVWAVADLHTKTEAALKLVRQSQVEHARFRREISIMRALNLPGVARFIDEGTWDRRPFLVMERIRGRPFPGRPGRWLWADVSGRVLAMLETLNRIHAAGVVHRDIKPANILVDDKGTPIFLDFGLSRGIGEDHGLTRSGLIMGTPEYLAPEQIRGEAPSERTDLYSIGVLLYEVLTGTLPHCAESTEALFHHRLSHAHRPLKDFAPDIPAVVSSLVDRLLKVDPQERPQSVFEVIGRLRGEWAPHLERLETPWLGGSAVVERVVDRARRGESVDVVSERGGGRSRCLREAAARLAREGREIVWLETAARPFGSLAALVGSLDAESSSTLEKVSAAASAALSGALGRGVIVIADDHERIDPWTADSLKECCRAGAVIRGLLSPPPAPGAELLQRLGKDDLRPLFAGPDRIFHLQEDAARALWIRTEGVPSAIHEEINAWTRAGLVHWISGHPAITSEALEQLEAGLTLEGPLSNGSGSPGRESPLPVHLADLLGYVAMLWPHTTIERLSDVSGEPRWKVEAETRQLAELGRLHFHENGRIEPRWARYSPPRWSREFRASVHARIAENLPEGAERRLIHLIAPGTEQPSSTIAVMREAYASSERLARDGHLRQATLVLGMGLSEKRLRTSREKKTATKLLALLTEIALLEQSPRLVDRSLYELSRIGFDSEPIRQMTQLLRAWLLTDNDGLRALELLRTPHPFASALLEKRRLSLCVLAARKCSLSVEETVVGEAIDLSMDCDDDDIEASRSAWLGRLRYRQGLFSDAAAAHGRAAELERWQTAKIGARLNAASAMIEAFAFEEASAHARAALPLARACRAAFFEARAEWILRTVEYRSGASSRADEALVAAAALLGKPDQEAVILLTEAAIAWRAGDLTLGRQLAERLRHRWIRMKKNDAWGERFARCLEIACGAPSSGEEIDRLGAEILQCPTPGVVIQALGLLGPHRPERAVRWHAQALELREQMSPSVRGVRMDILSADEAVQRLADAAQQTPEGCSAT